MGLLDSLGSLASAANLLSDTDGNGQIWSLEVTRAPEWWTKREPGQ